MPYFFILALTAAMSFYPAPAGVKADIEFQEPRFRSIEMRTAWITAYSSTPEETDDTPFTTASGQTVRDGIVATNLYPFGTKIKIPSLFGNKTFEVQDRMHSRKKNGVDVWMQNKEDAVIFGAHRTTIVALSE